jgi:hypothetical protein
MHPKQKPISRRTLLGTAVAAVTASTALAEASQQDADEIKPVTRAIIDGQADGFQPLKQNDFTKVNSADDTWTFEGDLIKCTGKPVSVIRTKKQYTNFELTVQWMHHKPKGNSGVFVWTTPESIERLTKAGKPGLPQGIEVQVLDLAYGQPNPADWYTSHGDVFPVGVKMKPFPPLSPNGSRSFPSQERSRPHGQWNHYYVRAINGEVRLWVNGEEVSGGTNCEPRTGYLCLESEGSPITFRGLRIREVA